MIARVRLAGALVVLGALVAAEVAALRIGQPGDQVRRMLWLYALAAALFCVGALLVRGLPTRQSLRVILAGGALLQIVAVSYAPSTTDDYYRYVWDGKVQSGGIDPYRYAPLDPALGYLRDELLFPADARTPAEKAAAVAEDRYDPCTTGGVPHDCTLINRPSVHTIYPPVAEFAFLGLHWVSPQEHRVLALQLFTAALAMAVAVALIWSLRRAGRDPRAAVWWAWCPVVWLECGNNAHIDVLGILLLIGCFGLLGARDGPITDRRLGQAGALFGAAIAVKLVPVLVAPALLIKRGHVLLGSAAAVFVVGYLPHLLLVGTDVIGYLPGYLEEEGYSGQQRFGVPRLLVPESAATIVAVLIGAGIAALVWRQAGARPSAQDALLVVGAAFVLVGPSQPWYGLMIVAFVVLADRPEWIAVAAAAYPVYQAGLLGVNNSEMQQRAYLPAALLVLAVTLARRPQVRACVRPAASRR